MKNMLDFLSKYYLIFDIIALFLIFALVGYFVNIKKEKNNKFKIDKKKTEENNFQESIQSSLNTNMSLQDLVKENKNNLGSNNVDTL